MPRRGGVVGDTSEREGIKGWVGGYGRGGGGVLIIGWLSHLTIDYASLSRRSTVPTPNRDTSNNWVLNTLLPYTT